MGMRTELRAFFLSEYEEEQAYLQERHQQGWKLVSAYPYVYRFAACQPESFVYETDFTPAGRQERERRIEMYADYGWEHVLDCMQFSYFRKKAAEAHVRTTRSFTATTSPSWRWRNASSAAGCCPSPSCCSRRFR